MKKHTKKILRPIVAGLVIGLLLGIGIFVAKNSVHGRFATGTVVGGVNIAGKTFQEGKTMINTAAEEFLLTEISITADEAGVKTSFSNLGVSVLTEETLETINEVDARKSSFLKWFFMPEISKEEVPLLVEIPYDRIITKLNGELALTEKAPINATFYFDEKNKLQIQEEKEGVLLDSEGLFARLKNSAQTLTPQNIALKLNTHTPTITKAKLEDQKEAITESLRHQFVLIDPIYSDDWYVKLTEHLDWVEFIEKQKISIKALGEVVVEGDDELEEEGEVFVAIEVNQDKLDEFIDAEISQWLDVPVEPVNIYTDEIGGVVIEGKGYNGKMVQRKHLKKGIELAVENKIRNVPIPVIDVEPEITVAEDLQDLGIKERVSIGHTSYYGSPANRVHNIKTGAAKFNGTVIAPGETFSFNMLLGEVDASTGYRKELVIKKEGTIPEYGGGLCQVSTTFYRTILFGGLPVVARREHSYAVSYYSQVMGHGLDATIYLGGQDLQFQNDTEKHILIQTFTKDDYELYVAFYGTNDGREIEMDGPYLSGYYSPGATIYEDTNTLSAGQTKQVERAHTGFKALWYRYITDKKGEQTVETINSHYKAVPAKILVGTGE